MNLSEVRIAILGLGYVGLPLAVEFSKKYPVIGFDINMSRINELKSGADSTLEVSEEELSNAQKLSFSNNVSSLKDANVYIVTVPTPIDDHKRPDLSPLIKASATLGGVVVKGDIVIYESTVYPGATEDECIPVIEAVSGLKFNKDFFAGYSPERINPGDKERNVSNILKVTSGSTPKAASFIDDLYSSIIVAGTFKASSIKVAEGSKIIENVQRDVNIAFINEIFQIFTNMGIDTNEVIEAASTKWNFMKLKPGLVGGHCIGVDPYYLLHKSGEKGYIPDLMRKGREINDGMSGYLVNDFLKNLINKKINPIDLEVTILGFTFKENCPDIRNTKVYDLYMLLQKSGFQVQIYDPVANSEEVFEEYGVKVDNELKKSTRVAFLAVGHEIILSELEDVGFEYIYDFKGLLKK